MPNSEDRGDEATDQKTELRFDADIDHPSINRAVDYEFEGTIPGG